MTVTEKEYWTEKTAFFKKHEIQHIYTSNMDEYGVYYKNYICAGHHIFTEIYSPVVETVKAKTVVHGIEVELEQDVKFFRTEYYSTENAKSKYYYERY